QINPHDIALLPGVVRIVDNREKDALVTKITGTPIEPYDLEPHERQVRPGAGARTRAFIKVQDGCDNKCTFCMTTLARGHSRSCPLEEIIREVQMASGGGYQEVVLTGVNLVAYGQDLGLSLTHLLKALLQTTDIPRIRLSSLEPWDLDEHFFHLWENARLCRHLHLPLQSGCDRTLKRMLRRTSQAEYRNIVQMARQAAPEIALSTDFIVGFPGETDDDFAESYAFAADMDFMKIHVFPYSAMPGTPAARMKDQTDKHTSKERVRQIQQLSDEGGRRFYARFDGQTMPVLWEGVRGANDSGFLHTGLTDNFIRVEVTAPDVLTNTITPTKLVYLTQSDVMQGQIKKEGAHV
ncbi:MAG: MiaB/RimO family radical SAM methylthiotransferase, partial [Anaerolineae bacterium]|nr:MiaB/RimO family radical SAM methylthiotransferase [Anaerolineae bacterium]